MNWGFWEWCRLNDIAQQQQQANELLAQNNQLLEKIRRLQLTPAQRAREDALRAAEAQLALEEERAKERREAIAIVAILAFIGIVFIAAWIAGTLNLVHASPDTAVVAQPTPTPIVQVQPGYAPKAELVRLPNQ
jgi:hypothetical protein